MKTDSNNRRRMPGNAVFKAVRELSMTDLERVVSLTSKNSGVDEFEVYRLADEFYNDASICYEVGPDTIHLSQDQKQRMLYAAYFTLAGINPFSALMSLNELLEDPACQVYRNN